MNEQEYMNHIKKQAENVPIPDSISPENMKKMLDEHIASSENNITDNEGTKNIYKKKWTKTIVAACASICILGGIGFSVLGNRPSSVKSEETAQNEAVAEESADSAEPLKGDVTLAYQTTMNTPASYDEYYDTIKAVYDDYYDSYAEVTMEKDSIEKGSIENEDVEDELLRKDAEVSSYMTNDLAVQEISADKEKDFSTTNTQEENIDEADIVKTDGDYIYKSGGTWENGVYTNTLTITKATNGELTKESSIDLQTCISKDTNDYVYFQEFYLYHDYLILLFQNYTEAPQVTIVIYDISDKTNPVQKKVFTQSGSYEGSRISDGFLYTISNFADMDFSVKKEYSSYIPSVNDQLIDCSKIYYPDDALLDTTFVITSLDIDSLTITDNKAIPANGGGLYVSDSSIYIYGTIYADTTQTEILRIAYDKGTLSVGKSAVLTGYLYGSFALNEFDNHLRVVATIPANRINLLRTEDMADNKADDKELKEDINVLYIFDETMTLTGKISGIAPGEQIRSARFLGDYGYIVTFETVDPLFSIDLSDPANPEIVGRLSLPGFSEYLHPYGDGFMLGIGQEIDPDTQTFIGLKLSMFDIRNPEEVTLLNQQVIEDGYYSPAENNHKALMIDTKNNIFGFFYQEQVAGKDYTYTTNNYYVTYQYDSENGFVETGRYKVDMESYDVDTVRGLYIDDYLYITTSNSITSYELKGTKQIDSIKE